MGAVPLADGTALVLGGRGAGGALGDVWRSDRLGERWAERARGLGPDAVAQLDQQMSSGPAPHLGEGTENFGYNSRDRLRRELEKSRRDGTGKQTSPQFCTTHMHVCSYVVPGRLMPSVQHGAASTQQKGLLLL